MFRSEWAGAGRENIQDELVDGLLKTLTIEVFDGNVFVEGLPESI